MPFKLDALVGKKDNKQQEVNVNSDEDLINKKINERLRRKEKLAKEFNKLHDPDIA